MHGGAGFAGAGAIIVVTFAVEEPFTEDGVDDGAVINKHKSVSKL
jgi:hypothetical protein